MKTNLNYAALLRRIQAWLAPLLLCCMAAAGHTAQPRIVFHEIVNPGAGKLVSNLGSYPAMSGNGNVVAYSVSRADSQLDLFGINADGTGQHSLGLFPHNSYRPAISYNGALAALWHNNYLYTLNTTSGVPVNVLTMTTPGALSSIAVNDDGSKVYFTLTMDDLILGTTTNPLKAGVWEMNPNGSGRRLIADINAMRAAVPSHTPGSDRVGAPEGLSISQNNRIVFSYSLGSSVNQTMGVNADGSGLRLIGPQVNFPNSVTISRDGSRVAFDQYSPKNVNTVGWDNTGHVVQVVPGHGSNDPLRLTDNGSHLALVDRLLRSDGGTFRSLRSGTSGSVLADTLDAPFLQISADGRKICAVRNFGTTSSVMMIELDPDTLRGAPDISNTAMTPGYLVHNNSSATTATAQVTYFGTPNGAYNGSYVWARLFQDGLPDQNDYAGDGGLFDDGTNGDAVSGNGLFTQNQFTYNYTASAFGPRVVRFVAENIVSGLRHATMVDHQPFFVLAAAPSGSAPVITSITPNPGTAGGTITINGSNFGITRTGNVVTLGGYSCYVLTANGAGTQLTVEVPRFFVDGSYPAIVSANGQSSAPFAFSIGTAVPEIAVEQPAGTGIADGGSKDFGSVNTGANTSLIFTIKNTGSANLTGLTITKDGTNSADFTVTSNPTAPVSGPSGSTTFTVQFAPGGIGARTAALHIANNDSNESPYDITLTGTGTSAPAPEIAVEQPVGTNISDGGSKDFGSVSSGSNASLVFTIKNAGNANLTGLTITKDGANSGDFTVTANPTAPVSGPSGSTTFTVQFAPGGVGARTAALHIANNDGDENPFDITLTGTGTAAGVPEIVVEQPASTNLIDSGSTIAWGSVAPGSPLVRTFTLRNTGTGTLNLTGVTKNGTNAADFTVGSLVSSIAAGGSATFDVTFNPSTLGAKSAAIHIGSNDGDENPFDINLTGIGVALAIFRQDANDPFTGANYTGAEDVWLYTNGPSTGTENRNTGADTRVITGGIPDGPRHALMRFNLTSLAGQFASISKVTLRLFWQSNSGAFDSTPDTLRVYRVASANSAWVEGNGFAHLTSDPGWSTWSHRIFGTTSWAGTAGANTAGTDYVNTIIGSKAYTLSEVAGDAFDIDLTDTSFVADWVAGNNSGLYLRTLAEDGQAIFHSSESTTASLRPQLIIEYSATGAPEIAVEQPVGTNIADGGSKSFGNVNTGSNASLGFTIKNTGGANLTGLGITIDGANAGDFSVTANPTAPVSGPSGSTAFTVRFAPTTAGAKTAVLHIANNDGDENPFDITLMGTGVAAPVPDIDVSPSTLGFGVVNVGSTRDYIVSVNNTGGATLNVTNVTTDNACFTIVSPAVPFNLAAGGYQAITIRFAPTTAILESATLSITSNDPDESPVNVALNGTGTGAANVPAVMLTPLNGSTLTAAATTFTWDTGAGVTAYYLWIGSAPNGYDLFVASEGTNRTRTVTLPDDGRTIYVRLWSLISGVWQYNSYTYVCYRAPMPVKAQMIDPPNGSTLTSTTPTFTWNAGVGCTQYWLFVGTYAGGADVYSASQGTALMGTVTVPAGKKLYVTLWSLIKGVWQGNSYVYNGVAPAPAVLTSPTNGSTLAGSSLNLTWTTGVGVTSYALWVGSSPGGYDLGAASTTSTSRTFTVPVDGGPVYVTLWSLINGAYQSSSYWFITAATAPQIPARITSHANASTLPSALTTFTWDAGTGPASYALWVGSSPDGYDLYAANEGTNRTRTVTLPTDGRRIYVTLHSLISGAYQSNSYYFTAFTAGGSPAAQITSPATGSTLAGTSLALSWSAGTGVSSYSLWVGSNPQGYDLYAGSEGTNRLRTITVPADGRPVYVTLWSLINGAYQQSSAWFFTQSAVSNRAHITSPANDTTLAGTSTTFNWDNGTGVSSYVLWIGSAPGGYDLYAGSEGLNHSKTITLPTDGRKIYVSLWSLIGGAYVSTSYFYNSANIPPVKATMISPANASILPGASTTFTWNAGTGVNQYALWVGRAPGGYEIYAGAEGTHTTKTVTLPTDGGWVYVTLWSLINGAWQSSEYYYVTPVP